MVTVGAGLMEATSIAYLFKNLPLKSWLVFCDKFGLPGLHGETPAAPESDEWNRFRDALANFAQDWALITSAGAKINTVEVNATGTSPHKDLVDRMDRAIARLWRGADLGTLSKDGQAVGANPQESETDILCAADAQIISETLQHYVDRWVIRYRFGTAPRAYFKLQPKTKVNLELELKVDDALLRWGVPRSKQDLLERYGRPEPDAGEELATAGAGPAPAGAGAPGGGGGAPPSFGNEAPAAQALQFAARAAATASAAQREFFRPLLARLAAVERLPDPAAQRAELERLRVELPFIGRELLGRAPELAPVWERILSPALVSGFAEAAAAHARKP
jgi:hypothetical protein